MGRMERSPERRAAEVLHNDYHRAQRFRRGGPRSDAGVLETVAKWRGRCRVSEASSERLPCNVGRYRSAQIPPRRTPTIEPSFLGDRKLAISRPSLSHHCDEGYEIADRCCGRAVGLMDLWHLLSSWGQPEGQTRQLRGCVVSRPRSSEAPVRLRLGRGAQRLQSTGRSARSG